MKLRVLACSLTLTLVGAPSIRAQPGYFQGDAYTAYHLLEPGSAKFRVVFYPSETEPGSTLLVNGTRPGSKGSDIEVYDPETGDPLKFEYLSGEELIADKTSPEFVAGAPPPAAGGLRALGNFTPGEHYIRAHLTRPVPVGGEGRVYIEKTYWDPRTYFLEGDVIVYKRSLGVGRQSIVLPKGYGIVSSNVAGQVIALPDGRVGVSFANPNGFAADVTIRGRKTTAPPGASVKLVERAFDRTKVLYDLQDPGSHAMTVTVDYIEEARGNRSRPPLPAGLTGVTATNLDTAKPLAVSRERSAWVVALERPIDKDRQSAHVKVQGSLTDEKYVLSGDELVFERKLYGVRTAVLLPRGWDVTQVSTPATVGTDDAGRVFVRVVNGRPEDEVPITLRARKRAATKGLTSSISP